MHKQTDASTKSPWIFSNAQLEHLGSSNFFTVTSAGTWWLGVLRPAMYPPWHSYSSHGGALDNTNSGTEGSRVGLARWDFSDSWPVKVDLLVRTNKSTFTVAPKHILWHDIFFNILSLEKMKVMRKALHRCPMHLSPPRTMEDLQGRNVLHINGNTWPWHTHPSLR